MKTLKGTLLLKLLLTLCIVLCIGFSSSAQCTLGPGDLVFTGYNQLDDNTNGVTEDDSFSFLLLKDIPAGQVIFFTDLGWTGTAFQIASNATSDAVLKWTADVAYPAGTEIIIYCKYRITAKDINGVTRGTVVVQQAAGSGSPTERMSLAEISGDQIFAFTNSIAAPTFLAGISINRPASGPDWDLTLLPNEFAANKSTLPASLSSNAQNLGIKKADIDDPFVNAAPVARFIRTNPINRTGTAAQLLAKINNPAGWEIRSDGNPFDNPIFPPAEVFTVNGVFITLQPANRTNLCPGSATSFTVTADNACTYQWEVSDDGTIFTPLVAAGVYSNVTTATLNISNVNTLNNKKYRVKISGANGQTSNIATLTLLNPTVVLPAGPLPQAPPNIAYNASVAVVSGGNGTFTYAVTSGSLPTGLTLNTSTGAITGTPTVGNLYNFDIKATDNCTTPNTTTKAYSIIVGTLDQTITLNDYTKAYGDPTFTLPATSSAGLTISYTSQTLATATVSGNTVTIVGVGTTLITATQGGNSSYNPATPVSKIITVTKKNITLSLNAAPVITKVYDNTNSAALATGNYNLAGILAGETVGISGTATYDNANAGTLKDVTVNTFLLSGTHKDNYNLTTTTATVKGNITPLSITPLINPLPLITKIYDNTTTATLVPANYSLPGTLGTDVVTLSGTANYDTKSAGTDKNITVNNFVLAGAQKDNYSLSTANATVKGNVTPKAITLTLNALPLITKIYDNSTDAPLIPANIVLTGTFAGDAVTVSANATYSDKNIGIAKTITANTFILTGAQKDNYSLSTTTATITGNITPKSINLVLNASPVITKVYDNNSIATLAPGNYTLNGVLGTDAVSASGTATYNTKDAGINKTVTAGAFLLSGAQKDNYSLNTLTATVSGIITALPVTVSLNASPLIAKIYDGQTTATLAAGNYNLTGTLGTDAVTVSGTASYDTKDVGIAKTITAGTFVLAGAQKDNYSVSTVSATTTGNVTTKPVTLALNALPFISKTFDNTTVATLNPGNYTLSGILSPDVVTVTGTAAYDTKAKGAGKTITANTFVLAGAQKDNYNLTTSTATTSGEITSAPLTLSLNASPLISKIYDKTTTATLTPANYNLSGIFGSDIVSVTGTANYDNNSAGTGKTVTASNFVLAGANKDNYSLITTTANTMGDISPKAITLAVNATPLIHKIYDGNSLARLVPSNYVLNGIIAGDVVTASGIASYDTKNQGIGKTVIIRDFGLLGAQKDNYNLTTATATTTGNISAAPIILALNASPLISKVYDNNTSVTLAPGNYSLYGIIGTDNVSVTGTANYNTKNAGTGKAIAANNFVLDGAEKDNYSLATSNASTTGEITPKPLNLTLNAAPLISKVYDNSTATTLALGNYSLTGILGTDAVTVLSGTANFDNKDTGTGKTITANAFVLAGAQKDNYSVNTATATTTGNITAKPITLALNALPIISKAYDNTTLATLEAGNYTLTGLLGTDVVTASGTANYNTKTKGTGKTITANTFVLAGAQKDNYNLTTTTATTTGEITSAPLTLSLNALPLISKVYDHTSAATLDAGNYNLNGIFGSDVVSVTGTANYENKDAGTGKTITANAFILGGTDKDNYSLNTATATTTGNITAKAITLALNASPLITKNYDGNISATLAAANYALNGILGTDVVTVSGTANYDTKTKAAGKTITAGNFILAGAQKDNYNLTTTNATTTGSIGTSLLTLSLNASPLISKVYDNNTSATLSPGNYSLNGIVGADVVNVTGTANYDTKAAGTGKTVTANTFVLNGADKDNYTLATTSATTTGEVTAKSLSLALNAMPLISKVYDNNTLATLNPANYELAGILGTDIVTTSGAASYDNPAAGTGKTITVNSFVLAGAQKDNYTLSTTTATTTGNISPKAITAALNATPLITKVYDNNTLATLTAGNYSLQGVLGSDLINVTATANYDSKDAGTGKTLTANAFVLSGADKNNYSLTTTTASTTGNIGQKAITATLNATPLITKVYDNNRSAILAPANYSLSGILGTDMVTISGAATYDTKNTGTGKSITAASLLLSGAQKDNYSLSNNSATTTGNITSFPLNVMLNASPLITKIYDGNTSTVLSPANYSLNGIKGTDEVSVSGTANYNTKDAGNGKTVNAGTFILAGADKDNYSISNNTASTTGNISLKELTVTADHQSKFQGTPNPPLTFKYSGFTGGDGANELNMAPIATTTANANSAIGDYDIILNGGADENYSFIYVKGILKVLPGAPTDVLLASVPLFENRPSGTTAGTLSATSDNPTATFTYSLVAGAGDTNNDAFIITGNQLKTKAVFDFESKSSYSIRVRATTQFGLSLDKSFNVSISDVNEIPTLSPIADQIICYTNSTQNIPLTGITTGPETSQTITLTLENSNANLLQNLSVNNTGTNGSINYRVKNGSTGTATITVTVKDDGGTENGGVDTYTRTFVITVNPLPVVLISADRGNINRNSTEVSKGETVLLTATGGSSYAWSAHGSILNGLNNAVLTVRPRETTTYTVTVTNANGCKETGTFTVNVLDDLAKIKATNILTPNGDGYNDKWVVDNIDFYPNNEIKIFDKAGRQLYSKRGYDNSWDGTFNGTALAEGTYYYVIDFGDNRPKFKGFITIVREN